MYLIISEIDGYMKEKNGSKYLAFDSANENNEILKKYNEYKSFMKIKFHFDNLTLNKTLKLHNMTIVIRSVFEEHGKFCPQVYLDECLYEL